MRTPSLLDRLAVWWFGGVRIRVLNGGPQPEAAVVGGLKDLPGADALQLVLELAPSGPGVVHIIRIGEGRYWKVKVSGPLSEGNFAQRLRNVLGSR